MLIRICVCPLDQKFKSLLDAVRSRSFLLPPKGYSSTKCNHGNTDSVTSSLGVSNRQVSLISNQQQKTEALTFFDRPRRHQREVFLLIGCPKKTPDSVLRRFGLLFVLVVAGVSLNARLIDLP